MRSAKVIARVTHVLVSNRARRLASKVMSALRSLDTGHSVNTLTSPSSDPAPSYFEGFLVPGAKMRAPVNSLKLLAIMSPVADPEVDLRGFT
jgi:hypothetical protein